LRITCRYIIDPTNKWYREPKMPMMRIRKPEAASNSPHRGV